MGDGSRIPGLLYWLALVPTAVVLGLEAQVKRVSGGRLRVYNAVDLSLMTVFYHVVFEDLCNAVFSSADWRDQGARRRCRRTAAALILVFQVGRSVHIAADAIHTYATEIHPEYRMRLPPDLLELIYFLDEDLGHWLLFISYYCLLALLTCCSPGQCAAAAPLLPCRADDGPPQTSLATRFLAFPCAEMALLLRAMPLQAAGHSTRC